ncbi:GNAT family N-acetyltransferase [Subtercola boreus]|uniref:GNAT family N-acetyltransferase n=1 Tax=Subtercola boreus TaxID=120213 RepID=A0A3E0VNP2_9MICO|nr:GNAT family N-acetyltransferase [Subtercola boreus]RFA10507.1 GNAT family N-acetyltransferase [Subtercola boreus]TQL55956.1 RimJ/RimL family protein N-acetyltransferase [Subtercola boreus]
MLRELSLPTALETRDGSFLLRDARPTDLAALIFLMSDDPISAGRGDVASPDDLQLYATALERIAADPSNALLVVVDRSDTVVGTMQLTVIPGMARRGSTRLLVEAVRVQSAERSKGIGGAMMRWVTDTAASELGARLVQLTSDAARTEAHRFYERLGFTGSHIGYKYSVEVDGI